MRWTWATIAILGAVICGLLWQVFDNGVSLTHARREIELRQHEAKNLLSMIRASTIGMSEDKLNSIGEELKAQGIPVQRRPQRLEIASIVFVIENNRVVAVEQLQ